MKDEDKTKEQLVSELKGMRQRIAQLEASESERRRAEEALEESKRFFSGTLDNLLTFIGVLEPNGKVIFVNNTPLDAAGLKQEDVVGKMFYDTYWWAHSEEARQTIKKNVERCASGESLVHDIEAQMAEGSRMWVEYSMHPIYDKEGEIEYLVAEGRDITERRQAVEALQESEEKYRSIFDKVPASIMLSDKDGKIVAVNPYHITHIGKGKTTPEDYLGKNLATHPSNVSAGLSETYAGLLKGEPFDLKDVYFPATTGGTDGYFNVKGVPIFKEGKVIGAITMLEDITERKRAEEALRESEAKYRGLVTNVKLGVFRSTPGRTGRFLEVNPAMHEITGYRRKELLQMNVSDLYVHPEERESVLGDIASGRGKATRELHLKKKDGTEIVVSDTKVAVRDDAGKILYFDGIIEDITERKRAEEKIRRVQERFSGIYNSSKDAIGYATLEGALLDVNDAFCKLTGYSREEFLAGKKYQDITPKEYHEYEAKIVGRIIRTGKPEEYVKEYIRKDGSRVPILLTTFVVKGDEDKPIGVAAIIKDITKRKQAEETLKIRAQLLDAATDSILVNDFDGNFIYANEAACKMRGYSKDELMRLNLYDLHVPEDAKLVQLRIKQMIEKGEATFEVAQFRKDKSIVPVEVHARFIESDGRQLIFSVARDITERKQAEEELRKYRDHLEEMVAERTRELREAEEKLLTAERLATLGQFSGSISHELRNPLGVIDSSAYYLDTRLKDTDEKVLQHLHRIRSSVDSATAIIESLFSLTRIAEPQLEVLDLIAITSDALATFEVPAEISVMRNFPESPVLVNADPKQLGMAFNNIVKNAVEAMGGKGTLTVTISRTTDGKAAVSFADTGPGIAPGNLERVFQPLFSTKAKGIGFGLSIVKMIVDKHGGTIEAQSQAEKGAACIIRLPLSTGKIEEVLNNV
jgi:PAS domain S-box-containing protein